MLNKIFKNQKIELQKQSTKEVPDSDIVPDYIKFVDDNDDNKDKKVKAEKHNEEAIPTDE